MSFGIQDIKKIIEKFNTIESSSDEGIIFLEEDKFGDGTLGDSICCLMKHKKLGIYFLVTYRQESLHVEPAFCRYQTDPLLKKKHLDHRVINNVSMQEFLESEKYTGLEEYILSPEVFDEYVNLIETMYRFEGSLDDFHRTDKKLDKDNSSLKYFDGYTVRA